MKSETTASTAIPQPAIAIPVWPVGTKRASSPRARAARSSSSETVIFPIAQSEPTVSTICAGTRQVRAGGDVQVVRRAAQVAQLDAVARRQLGQLRVVGQELVQPVLDVQALRDAALQELAPGRREAAALGRDADHAPSSARSRGRRSPSPTIGTPACVSPARVESRSATTCRSPYASTPRAVFP